MFIDRRFTTPHEGIALLREIFIKKISYFQACANNNFFSSERRELANRITNFMKMKLQHTMFVQKEGVNILRTLEKLAVENPTGHALIDTDLDNFTNIEAFKLAGKYLSVYNKALLWHDLGRVAEFDDDLKPRQIDHAVVSREILEQKKEQDMVILIVRNHGYHTNRQMYEKCEQEAVFLTLSPEEKRACKLLSLMVRDADKLGNWKTFVRQGINREITRKIKPEVSRSCVSVGQYEMDCVRNNKSVDYSKYTNFTGVQIAHIMWSSDMAFTSTKDAAIEGGLVEGMLEYMNEVAQDDTAMAIQKAIPNALEDYQLFLEQQREVFHIMKKSGWISPLRSLNTEKIYNVFLKRLQSPNYATPRVLTNGLRRYNKLLDIKSKQR